MSSAMPATLYYRAIVAAFVALSCMGALPWARSKTILETATEAGSFTTLVAAVTKAELVETLSRSGPFTVFAPSDNAFSALLAKLDLTAEALLARDDLAEILKVHVAAGRLFSTHLSAGVVVQTLEGARVEVNLVNGVLQVETASVTTVDLNCSNGVIHVIDSVLLPPDRLRLAGGSSWEESLWRTEVDGVMGGKSSGAIGFEDGAMVFSGVINLDGGGFSQARKEFSAKDLSAYVGLIVELDSQSYSRGVAPLGLHLEVHTRGSRGGNAVAFAVPLSEAGEGLKLFIPMSTINRPSYRWTGSWDLVQVTGLQFSVLFQGGPFVLRVRRVSAVRRALDAPFVTIPVIALSSAEAVVDLIQAAINSGAVLYDKGYKELCIAQYTSVTRTILVARNVSAATKGIACAGLVRASQGESTSKAERAWVLRRAFDALLMDLQEKPRVPESRYPLGGGNWLPGPNAAGVEPGACAALRYEDATGYAGLSVERSPNSDNVDSAEMEEAGSADFEDFLGPFVGMGISGHNDFGVVMVASPAECARRCRSQSNCRSFDYGSRGQVAGECWLSRANRAMVGHAYSPWVLYDYYEKVPEAKTVTAAASTLGEASKSQDTESLTSSALFWAMLTIIIILLCLLCLAAALMYRSWMHKSQSTNTVVVGQIAFGNPGGNVVTGKPVDDPMSSHKESAFGA